MALKLNRIGLNAVLLPLLAGVTLGAAAAPAPVQAWITTGDQSKLLARGKDAAFGAARGGKVVIDTPETRDTAARDALHDFLRFQIREHQTGDPLTPK